MIILFYPDHLRAHFTDRERELNLLGQTAADLAGRAGIARRSVANAAGPFPRICSRCLDEPHLGEISVQGERFRQAHAPHQDKAGAIGEGQNLILVLY